MCRVCVSVLVGGKHKQISAGREPCIFNMEFSGHSGRSGIRGEFHCLDGRVTAIGSIIAKEQTL